MALVVDVQLTGFQSVEKGLTSISTQLRNLQRQLDAFNSKTQSIASVARNAASAIEAQARATSRAAQEMGKLLRSQQDYNRSVAFGGASSPTSNYGSIGSKNKPSSDALMNIMKLNMWKELLLGNAKGMLNLTGGQTMKTTMDGMPIGTVSNYWDNHPMPFRAKDKIGNLHPNTSYDTFKDNILNDSNTSLADKDEAVDRLDLRTKRGNGRLSQIKNFLSTNWKGIKSDPEYASILKANPASAQMVESGVGMQAALPAIAAGAAVAAIVLFVAGMKKAIAVLGDFAKLQATFGASSQNMGQLNAAGAVMGMSREELGSLQEKFIQNATNGGFAQSTIMNSGAYVSQNEYERSNQDITGEFNKFVQYLLSLPKEEGQRQARLAGMPELGPLLNGDRQSTKDLINSGGFSPSTADLSNLQNWNTEWAKFSLAFEKVGMAIGTLILPKLTDFLSNPLIGALELGPMGPVVDIYKGIADMVTGGPGKSNKTVDEVAKATKANTEAIEENTRALGKSREYLNGGSRLRNAVPAAWRFHQMDLAMQSNSMRLGAF